MALGFAASGDLMSEVTPGCRGAAMGEVSVCGKCQRRH